MDAADIYLRKLSRRVDLPRGLESATRESATLESLSTERLEEAHARAVQAIERETGEAPDAGDRESLEGVFLRDGKEALKRLKEAGGNADLSPAHVEALEAIVESDGSRPTLIVSDDDGIDPDDEALGPWKASAKDFGASVSGVARAVGRIDRDGGHCGTGFVVKDGLVLTNRHVLQALARQESSGEWTFSGEPTISFDSQPDESRGHEFKIRKRVVLAGKDAIDPRAVDYDKLDFAVLECEVPDAAAFPDPLPLESDADKVVVGRPVYSLGYPGEPRPGQYRFELLHRLFKYRFGVKRFAPGEIDRELGVVSETVFAHDSTTLGGSSGSCIVDFGDDGALVVGLHFAGRPGEANFAHSQAQLRDVLSDLGLTWKAWLG